MGGQPVLTRLLYRLVVGLPISGVAGGCGERTTAPLQSTDGVVYGRVVDQAGQPVPAAQVRILAYQDTCDPPKFFDQPVVSSADGRYRYHLRAPDFGDIVLCLEVTAMASVGGIARTGTNAGLLLTLHSRSSGRLDSTFVFITVK